VITPVVVWAVASGHISTNMAVANEVTKTAGRDEVLITYILSTAKLLG
jgi:hypothetical protein